MNCVMSFLMMSLPFHDLSMMSFPMMSSSCRLVKIWDYQNKACVQTLEGHAQNVTAVAFHSELPILMTGSEDGTEQRPEMLVHFRPPPPPPTTRNGPCVACQHLPPGDHSQLWSGEGLVHLPDEGLQRRRHRLRRRQRHDKSKL